MPGKADDHRQKPRKAPPPEFIRHLYRKRFGREAPPGAPPLEERARQAAAHKAGKRAPREAE